MVEGRVFSVFLIPTVPLVEGLLHTASSHFGLFFYSRAAILDVLAGTLPIRTVPKHLMMQETCIPLRVLAPTPW